MQDPNTLEPGGQAGGAPPSPDADGVPAPTSVPPEMIKDESTAGQEPSAGIAVDEAVGGSDEPAADVVAEAVEPVPAATTGTPAGDAIEGLGEAAEDGAGESATEGVDEAGGSTPADTPADPAGSIGETIPPANLTETSGTVDGSEVRPLIDEPVSDDVDTEATDEALVMDERAEDTEAPEPMGSEVAVVEPASTAAPQKHGVWTEEQVAAFRTRLSEGTAKVVDSAAGAVIEAINTVADAIRSRTASNRRSDDSRN
jgi:hypothetical protein